MITEEDIKTILYRLIKASPLNDAINGTVTKRNRHADSKAEDIVISVLTSNCAQNQLFIVNVNIYVPYSQFNNEEDSERLAQLSNIAKNVLKVNTVFTNTCDCLIVLSEQRCTALSDIQTSVITNRLIVSNN
jgi:hypothetical protein